MLKKSCKMNLVSIFLSITLAGQSVFASAESGNDLAKTCQEVVASELYGFNFKVDVEIEADHSISKGLRRAKVLSAILNKRSSLETFILPTPLFNSVSISLNKLLEITLAPFKGWLADNSNFAREGREISKSLDREAQADFQVFLQQKTYKSLLVAVKSLILATRTRESHLRSAFSLEFKDIVSELEVRGISIWITTDRQSAQTILEYLAHDIHIVEVGSSQPGTFAAHDVSHVANTIKIFNSPRVKWLRDILPEIEKIKNPHVKRLVLLQIFSLRDNDIVAPGKFLKEEFEGSFHGDPRWKIQDLENEYGKEILAPLKEHSIKWLRNYLTIHPFPASI